MDLERPADIGIRNRLLAGLPPAEIEAVRERLRPVTLVVHQEIYAVGVPIEDIYFIQEGAASLVADTADGASVEVGMIGREGLLGGQALLEAGARALHRTIIQMPGSALRMSAADLRALTARLPVLREHCHRFLLTLLNQAMQTAACNARHSLAERCAKWLLMVRDRTDTDTLPITQQYLAVMLGVRRPGVTIAAGQLQAAGLLRQSRGRITVTDRAGLARAACDCYRVLRADGEQRMLRAEAPVA